MRCGSSTIISLHCTCACVCTLSSVGGATAGGGSGGGSGGSSEGGSGGGTGAAAAAKGATAGRRVPQKFGAESSEPSSAKDTAAASDCAPVALSIACHDSLATAGRSGRTDRRLAKSAATAGAGRNPKPSPLHGPVNAFLNGNQLLRRHRVAPPETTRHAEQLFKARSRCIAKQGKAQRRRLEQRAVPSSSLKRAESSGRAKAGKAQSAVHKAGVAQTCETCARQRVRRGATDQVVIISVVVIQQRGGAPSASANPPASARQ